MLRQLPFSICSSGARYWRRCCNFYCDCVSIPLVDTPLPPLIPFPTQQFRAAYFVGSFYEGDVVGVVVFRWPSPVFWGVGYHHNFLISPLLSIPLIHSSLPDYAPFYLPVPCSIPPPVPLHDSAPILTWRPLWTPNLCVSVPTSIFPWKYQTPGGRSLMQKRIRFPILSVLRPPL